MRIIQKMDKRKGLRRYWVAIWVYQTAYSPFPTFINTMELEHIWEIDPCKGCYKFGDCPFWGDDSLYDIGDCAFINHPLHLIHVKAHI